MDRTCTRWNTWLTWWCRFLYIFCVEFKCRDDRAFYSFLSSILCSMRTSFPSPTILLFQCTCAWGKWMSAWEYRLSEIKCRPRLETFFAIPSSRSGENLVQIELLIDELCLPKFEWQNWNVLSVTLHHLPCPLFFFLISICEIWNNILNSGKTIFWLASNWSAFYSSNKVEIVFVCFFFLVWYC